MIKVGLKVNPRIVEYLEILKDRGFATNVKIAAKVSGERFQASWRKNVSDSKTPQGWKEPYINNIKLEMKDNNFTAEISADKEKNKFVKFVEDGQLSYDMKPGMLSSSKAKKTLTGKYITIFMRHKVKEMPKAVSDKKAKLNFYQMVGIKGELTKEYRQGMYLSRPGTIYHRMVRVGGKGHEGYGTFRRISTNSPESSWIRKGIKATKVFNKTVREEKGNIEKDLKIAFERDLLLFYKEMKG